MADRRQGINGGSAVVRIPAGIVLHSPNILPLPPHPPPTALTPK